MRHLLAPLVVIATALVLAAGAFASATPTQIYKDYADNGRLDGTYSRQELDAALKNAVLQGYGSPNLASGLRSSAAAAAAGKSSSLPFTGTDLALMVLGGGTLLLIGLGMRRLGRTKA